MNPRRNTGVALTRTMPISRISRRAGLSFEKTENEEFADEEEISLPVVETPDYSKVVMTTKVDVTWAEKICSDIMTKLGFAKFNGPKNMTLPEMLVKSPIEVWPF